MKKLILSVAMIAGLASAANAGYGYECSRYVKGDWKGYVKVTADSKTEAEYKARLKWEKMGKRVDSVNCK